VAGDWVADTFACVSNRPILKFRNVWKVKHVTQNVSSWLSLNRETSLQPRFVGKDHSILQPKCHQFLNLVGINHQNWQCHLIKGLVLIVQVTSIFHHILHLILSLWKFVTKLWSKISISVGLCQSGSPDDYIHLTIRIVILDLSRRSTGFICRPIEQDRYPVVGEIHRVQGKKCKTKISFILYY
jgi:hypothetical protein